jgi:eukaryotic-like serine/threonine-protein kinase
VLLFQMLAGRAPFVDDDAVVVMAKHIKNPPPELEEAAPGIEIPPAIEAVVRRALEKLPENRPASAEQMLSELAQAAAVSRAVESGVRPHVPEEGLPESLRVAERRMWLLGSALAAALLALVVVGVAVFSSPLKRWSAASATSASLAHVPDRAVEPSGTAASQPAAPTPAPKDGPASTLENSASIAVPGASAASADTSTKDVSKDVAMPAGGSVHSLHAPAPAKKPAPKTAPASPLERRPNERYGRFD